jgi:DNA-directed RNA polymerase subunit H (RpoH/RPB5)|uniref:RNA polymerase subunit H/Rpb5 C-terminal domain-containing protein n=1 Tax=viral metagenome TaxID=1070528 RepID=A0A6C0IMI5_9ZZZZ
MSRKTQQSLLISEVYKSRRNILDIMEKQNFDVSEYSNFSINEVNTMFNNDQMDMILENDKDRKIYIRYNLGSKINESVILNFVEDLFYLTETLKKTDTLFIITKEELNDPLSNVLKHIWEKEKVHIVIESIARLQFNILNHNLVPNHRIMNENEVTAMMEKYNILSFEQLPEINRFDPVAKLIGIKPKEVCEIKRPSKSAIESYYYRVCV